MPSRPNSAEFLGYLSPDAREKVRIKSENRIKAEAEYNEFISTADTNDLDITAVNLVKNQHKVLDSKISEFEEALEQLSRVNEREYPGVQNERNQILGLLEPIQKESKVLKRSAKGILEDMSDEITVAKRRRPNAILPNEIVSNAYVNSIMRQFNDATPKQQSSRFNKSAFRKGVEEYYSAVETVQDGNELLKVAFCQLTGKWKSYACRAAHIIPRSLGDDVIRHLLGSDEQNARRNPRNALMLHHTIEEAMDAGSLVIIPLPLEDDKPSRWKCVIIDPSIEKNTINYERIEQNTLRFKDIDNRELVFQNDNRPARRYLYLRFLISLTKARKTDPDILKRLQLGSEATTFWASPGPYVRESTMRELMRRISGLELPDAMVESTMFEPETPDPDEKSVKTEALSQVYHVTRMRTK